MRFYTPSAMPMAIRMRSLQAILLGFFFFGLEPELYPPLALPVPIPGLCSPRIRKPGRCCR